MCLRVSLLPLQTVSPLRAGVLSPCSRSVPRTWHVHPEWSKAGVPNLWDPMPDDPRWSCCNNKRNKVHNKCHALESSRNHTHTHTHTPLWKNCLPRNWSLVPNRLGTTALMNIPRGGVWLNLGEGFLGGDHWESLIPKEVDEPLALSRRVGKAQRCSLSNSRAERAQRM